MIFNNIDTQKYPQNVNDTQAHTCVIARDFRLWSGSGVNRKLLSIVKQETLEPRKL